MSLDQQDKTSVGGTSCAQTVQDILLEIQSLKEQLKIFKPKLKTEIFWKMAEKRVINKDLSRLQSIMHLLDEELDIPPWQTDVPANRT